MIKSLLAVLVLSSACQAAPMVDRASSSVIRVTGVVKNDDDMAPVTCTGFQIAPNRMLTAAHCIGNLSMEGDGKVAHVLKADTNLDLALVKLDLKRPSLVLRDRPVARFEELSGIGYAWGWNKLTVLKQRAIILNHSVGQGAPVGTIVQGGYISGMSGGPVVDAQGRVVGIIQRSHEGTGYGVGTLIIRAFLLGEDLTKDPTEAEKTPIVPTSSMKPIPFFSSTPF